MPRLPPRVLRLTGAYKISLKARLFKNHAMARGSETEIKRLMASGKVKWFNATKGFGFIQPSDGGKDVFVHITAVQAAGLRGLNEGQALSYEVTTERGKTAATNLKLS